MSERVTIVGNGVAGFACARRLAERGVEVVLIGPGLPCDRPPLTKRALIAGRLPLLADADRLRSLAIEHLDAVAVGFDRAARVLRLVSARGEPSPLPCEGHLVWATGVGIGRPDVPGVELADCNATPDGFQRVSRRLGGEPRRVVVLGGGLIGCETAATLAARHQVTLIERAPNLLGRMPPAVIAAATDALARAHVDVRCSSVIEAIERDAKALRVLTAGGAVPADVVIAATGVCRALPEDAGRAQGLGIAADPQLRVAGETHTWVCGDAAVYNHPRFGSLAVPHWDNAVASGRHVADAILGCDAPYVRDPYWFSDIAGLRVQVVGHHGGVAEWMDLDQMTIGADTEGRVACVVLINQPARMREARELVARERAFM